MKTMEERQALVESIIGNQKSFLTKPMRPGSCHNRIIDGRYTSYEFQLNTLSYRGIWISTIEDIELTVDGERIPRSNMMFFCNGNGYSIDNMVTHSEIFWGVLDAGIVRVYRVGGLPKGDHRFEIIIKKRADFGHSYGEGTQGYEDATEFHEPQIIEDACVYTIE